MAGTPRGKPKEPVSAEAARVGEILRLRRLSPKVNKRQEDVALDAGVNQKTISQIERGEQDFMKSGFENALAILDALSWSLAEFQQATGVGLPAGVTEATPLPNQEATPIYLLQDLLNPKAQPDAQGFFAPTRKPNPAHFKVVFMDSDEMTIADKQSIFKDAAVFLDLGQRTPVPSKTYAIEYKGKVYIRRYTLLPSGPAFTADNPAYALEFIPADQARVLGETYRINLDSAQKPSRTIN